LPFRPLILAAMMVVALGYLGFLAHMNVVLTDQQIAAMRVDRVKSVHSAVSYDLELNLKHAAALAGYRIGMAGGEPGELEPLAQNLLNERISRGFEYEVVRVEVPLAVDNSHSLGFLEDGSYATSVELDGEVEHVAGDVKLRGFRARASVPARWMLLYRLVRQEHPLNVAVAEQAVASGQDVGQVLERREHELNERYAGEGIEWEVSWGSVTTIARDVRVGPVVIVDGQKVPMAYRMSSEISAQPIQPPSQPQGQPTQPTNLEQIPPENAKLTIDTKPDQEWRARADGWDGKAKVEVTTKSGKAVVLPTKAPVTVEVPPGEYVIGFYGHGISSGSWTNNTDTWRWWGTYWAASPSTSPFGLGSFINEAVTLEPGEERTIIKVYRRHEYSDYRIVEPKAYVDLPVGGGGRMLFLDPMATRPTIGYSQQIAQITYSRIWGGRATRPFE